MNIFICKDIVRWVNQAKQNFYIELVSNNPSKKRIKEVAEIFDLNYTYKASKPKRKTLRRVIENTPYNNNEIAMIGDRLFTDIIVGNRLGLYTILVEPVDHKGNKASKNLIQRVEKGITNLITGKKL